MRRISENKCKIHIEKFKKWCRNTLKWIKLWYINLVNAKEKMIYKTICKNKGFKNAKNSKTYGNNAQIQSSNRELTVGKYHDIIKYIKKHLQNIFIKQRRSIHET